MTLLDFLEQNFDVPKNIYESVKSISHKTAGKFSFKNSYTIKKSSSEYINEVSIQKNIANKAKKPMPGYPELLSELRKTSPEAVIAMRFLDSQDWDGRVFFSEKQILKGVILGKKTNKTWETPPNWDGSKEMIEKYNSDN